MGNVTIQKRGNYYQYKIEVAKVDGKSHFLEVLNSIPLKIKYADLVGTSFTPRSSARCNGIVQATVKGQVRDFISDWPADNFVRWAITSNTKC